MRRTGLRRHRRRRSKGEEKPRPGRVLVGDGEERVERKEKVASTAER